MAREMYQDAVVALNPNSKDPRELLTSLKDEADEREYIDQETLDVGALERLKQQLGNADHSG